MASSLKSFAAVDRFLAEIATPAIRPGYVLLGSETFLYDRARKGVLQALVPPDLRDFSLHDLELSADTTIFDALDLAQTPSLMAPFQVIFLRGLKTLYGRGAKKEEFAAVDRYFRSPNPQALLVFVADHLLLPTDLRRMDREDKDRYDRIRETLGEHCGTVELQTISDEDAQRWAIDTAAARGTTLQPEAARELTDALAGNMLQISSELEKLILYVTPSNRPTTPLGHPDTITLEDVETMVLAAKQRSLYELTDAISRRDRPRAVLLLRGLLNSSDGGEDSAIGQLYMLARTFRQMLILHEKNVRESRQVWMHLWPGFRMPQYAVDDLLAQTRRYKQRSHLTAALKLIARADLAIRSSPVDKSLVLERLVLDLAADPATHFRMAPVDTAA